MKFKTFNQVFSKIRKETKGSISQYRMFSQSGRIQKTKRDQFNLRYCKLSKVLNRYKDQVEKKSKLQNLVENHQNINTIGVHSQKILDRNNNQSGQKPKI